MYVCPSVKLSALLVLLCGFSTLLSDTAGFPQNKNFLEIVFSNGNVIISTLEDMPSACS